MFLLLHGFNFCLAVLNLKNVPNCFVLFLSRLTPFRCILVTKNQPFILAVFSGVVTNANMFSASD